MDRLLAAVRHPELWTISVQLLILYVISTALFFTLYGANQKVAQPLTPSAGAGKAGASLLILTAAAASNFLGVVTIVFLAKKLSTVPRQALILVPLFLIIEKHFRAMRAAPAERRAHQLGALGVFIGMASSWYWLLKDSPIK